jgi:RNA polymerase sigma-70 factor (ECF subfamily)
MIARRRSIDWQRKQSRLPTLSTLDGLPEKVTSSNFSMRSIDRADLWEALRKLPEDTLDLFSLHFEKGMSHDEISKHTDIPVGTVKTRLRRGLIDARKLVREFSDLKGADK